MSVGQYKGIHYKHLKFNQVFPSFDSKALTWFICDDNQEPTADHFKTVKALKEYIDSPDFERPVK